MQIVLAAFVRTDTLAHPGQNMEPQLSRLRSFLLSSLSILLLCGTSGRAQNVIQSLPGSYFDVIDSAGHVNYWKTLAVLRIDADSEIPIVYGFNSSSDFVSPHFGAGWRVPLLESKMLLVDNNVFSMQTLDGRAVKLTRDAKNRSLLTGCQLTGAIDGNWISVALASNWKFSYFKGVLRKITSPSGASVELKYDADRRVESIRSADREILRCTPTAGPVGLDQIKVNGVVNQATMTRRPLIQVINGIRVVRQLVPALSSVVAAGTEFGSEYAYDVSGRMNPTLTLVHDSGRVVEWDAQHRRILKDGKSDVALVVPGAKESMLAITRTVGGKALDALRVDIAKGTLEVDTQDGECRKYQYHTSGALEGAVRRVSIIRGGRTETSSFSYDETAKLIRVTQK
jgi:YD repeat-containing protein